MGAWLQREWQRFGGGALVLLPLALVFALGSALRRGLYRAGILKAWRAPVPVVVVGNITVGGTGKTPLVLAVVESLLAAGKHPGVVSRGYGSVPTTEHDPSGVARVFPGRATPEHFGDEPVLIARRANVPVFISPDRPAAVRALLDQDRDVDVIVSDDGLQHYALARDVEIAVVDGERGFGNGLPLPSGPMREPRSRLKSVDAVVVNGGWSDTVGAPRQFAMHLGHEAFVALAGRDERDPAEFALAVRGARVVALAGIGNPERFFGHLTRLGLGFEKRAFADHHLYTPADLKLPGAEVIVMTEKDAVKCAAFADARMWFLRVDALLPPDFDAFLRERVDRARGARHGSQAA